MSTLTSLNINVLCEIASFLEVEDFRNFLSVCRRFSECRNDLRTVARVVLNGSPNLAEALKGACTRNFNATILRFIIRSLKWHGRLQVMDCLFGGHYYPYRNEPRCVLLSIFNHELSQDQKLQFLYRLKETEFDEWEFFDKLRKLLGFWNWTRESLLEMRSQLSTWNWLIGYLLDRNSSVDIGSLLAVFNFLLEFDRIDDAIGFIPRLTDEIKLDYITGEVLNVYMLGIPDQFRVISSLVESLSHSLGENDHFWALKVAAEYGNIALIERFQTNFDKTLAVEAIIRGSVEGRQNEIFDRYIDSLNPSESVIDELTEMVAGDDFFDFFDFYDSDRIFDVFMGEKLKPDDTPYVRSFATLLDRNFLNRNLLLNKIFESTLGDDLAKFRQRLIMRFGIRDLNQDLLLNYFTESLTTISDVEALAQCEFTKDKVDLAFGNIACSKSRDDVRLFEAFFKYWKPSEETFLDEINQLDQTRRYKCLDWLRAKRYFLLDVEHKEPLSNDEFNRRLSESGSNQYMLDYLLLDAACNANVSGCQRITQLLELEISPSQECIDEAFGIAARRIQTFMALKKRPSSVLVRNLVQSEHSHDANN